MFLGGWQSFSTLPCKIFELFLKKSEYYCCNNTERDKKLTAQCIIGAPLVILGIFFLTNYDLSSKCSYQVVVFSKLAMTTSKHVMGLTEYVICCFGHKGIQPKDISWKPQKGFSKVFDPSHTSYERKLRHFPFLYGPH